MPQIKEYTAENDRLRPSDLGVEAYGQAARRVGAFYQQAGEVIKQSSADVARAAEAQARAAQARAGAAGALATEEKAKAGALSGLATTAGTAVEQAEAFAGHQEVSHGVAGFAEASNGMIQKWKDLVGNQAATDPNNSSIRAGFLQGQFEPWAQKFVQSFRTPQGQDWASAEVNHLRNHLVETTAADMSTMAGVATNVNLMRTEAANSNTARNDPSSLDYLVGDPGKHNGAIHRNVDWIVSTSGLTGVEAVKARAKADEHEQSALRAGALGGIEQSKDPEAFAESFNRRWQASYDDPMLADQITRAGKAQARGNQIDQDRQQKLDDKQTKDASATNRDNYIKNVFSSNPTATIKDVLRDQKLTAQDREHLIGVMRRLDMPQADQATSQRSTLNLLADIRENKMHDTTAVLNAYKNGEITQADFARLNNEVIESRSPEGQAINAKKQHLISTIAPAFANDPDAIGHIYQWDTEVSRRMAQLRKDNKDPNAVFDAKSPEYMGSPEALKPFTPTIARAISGAGGVGAPREAADYDYAAAEKAGVKPDERGHMPDTYKLPNHMTFSDESIYSGKNGNEGGHWEKSADNKWSFTPSMTNLQNHTWKEMQEYFRKVEPDSTLKPLIKTFQGKQYQFEGGKNIQSNWKRVE